MLLADMFATSRRRLRDMRALKKRLRASERTEKRTLSRERLRRVTEYIEAHLAEPLSLTKIGEIACLSPFHFSRSFKRSAGVGLHEYVVRRRIERAKQLILYSDLSLAQIAGAVGFDSQSSFTARFRREVGLSPGRFRKEGR
jgi:AraC family transcriptional regulator